MKLIVANHKMNLTLPEVLDYKHKIESIDTSKVKLVICPSYPYLVGLDSNKYYLGSQNVGMLDSGALTGEISAKQLSFLHVSYVIVGHSERRTLLNENNNDIKQKIEQVLKSGMHTILCIGEDKDENEKGKTKRVLKNELSVLKDISPISLSKVIIAYEPIWSIGTGKLPSSDEIYDTIEYIKNLIYDEYDVDIKVLYGGSVSPDNIKELEKIKNIDGYLIGGASLNPKKLSDIISKVR